jgi:tetratricopeptide (TPR) repeat protein
MREVMIKNRGFEYFVYASTYGGMRGMAMKDFFVSYNSRDQAWAEWIAWELEEVGYSAVMQAWDFRPGGSFVQEMQEASSEAERTIAVISPNYLNALSIEPAWAMAFAQDAAGERKIVPVRVLLCEPQGVWSSILYVDLAGRSEEEARSVLLTGVRQEGANTGEGQHEVVSRKPRFPRSEPALPLVGIPQNVPRSGVVQFVGRETKMDELHEKLQQNERSAITAVKGMGGIGKTELALQYCDQHRRQGTYDGGVCWLQAREQDVGAQIVQFATAQLDLKPPEDLSLSTQLDYCWRRWRAGNVLIVFDHVTRYEDITPYLPPPEPRFKVLLTTRKELGQSVQSLSIDVLDETQALELLNALVQDERIEQQPDEAKALCAWLGYLPLGLELVGRYLDRKPNLLLSEIQKCLNEKSLKARALTTREEGMTAPLTVREAIELSWQELNEEAQALACLLSLFAPAPVSWELVQACLPERDSEELANLRDEQLVKLSLLKRTGEGFYQLHPLRREFFREKLESSERKDAFKRSYGQVLVEEAQRIPEVITREVVERVLPLVPHLKEAATTLLPWIEDENLIWPFVGLGRFYVEQGDYAQAQRWFEQGLAVCQERLGEEHPDVASSLNNLAALYCSQGGYEQAEPLYKRALAIAEKVLGPEHPNLASSLNNLAGLYRNQGRYEQAEPLYQKALAIREKVLGPEHPNVASSLNNLAGLYRDLGDYEQAEPLYQKALAIREKALGPEHPEVASSLNSLAVLYEEQGRDEKAEPLYRRALAIAEKALGPEHPDVAQSLSNLAELYFNQDRYSQAEPLCKRALAIRKKVLGLEHPDVASSLSNLGELYERQGLYGPAEFFYKKALAVVEKVLGPEHPDVASSLSNLAALYDAQGRDQQAEPLYRRALAIREKVLGPGHPRTIAVRQNYRAFLEKDVQE